MKESRVSRCQRILSGEARQAVQTARGSYDFGDAAFEEATRLAREAEERIRREGLVSYAAVERDRGLQPCGEPRALQARAREGRAPVITVLDNTAERRVLRNIEIG